MAASDPIAISVDVPVTPDVAFIVFTARLGGWWPQEYTWSGDALALIAIEPREGGRCFERGPERFECDWGRVTVCDPPSRL
ncbi:MAG: ATPase, partial [Solirubrobacteraceae bacterium]